MSFFTTFKLETVAVKGFFLSISERKYFPITFIGSIIWIALFSYLMVWWTTTTGYIAGISDVVSDHFFF